MSVLTDTAPKHIWLCISDDINHNEEPFPGDEVTWCDHAPVECTVEYVRADVAAADLATAKADRNTYDSAHKREAAAHLRTINDLAAARALIMELDEYEGAEGWSTGMRERIDALLGHSGSSSSSGD